MKAFGPINFCDGRIGANVGEARQRAYAIARGDGQVYTPQVVVNGLAHVVGSRKFSIEGAIARTQSKFSTAQVHMALAMEKGALIIKTAAAPAGAKVKGATIWLATVKKAVSIPIRRGENRGKNLTYYNVVTNMTSVGMWNGKAITVRLADQRTLLHCQCSAGSRRMCRALLVILKARPMPNRRR